MLERARHQAWLQKNRLPKALVAPQSAELVFHLNVFEPWSSIQRTIKVQFIYLVPLCEYGIRICIVHICRFKFERYKKNHLSSVRGRGNARDVKSFTHGKIKLKICLLEPKIRTNFCNELLYNCWLNTVRESIEMGPFESMKCLSMFLISLTSSVDAHYSLETRS